MKFKVGQKVKIIRGIHRGRSGTIERVEKLFHGNRVGMPYKVRVKGSTQSHLEGYKALDLS